MKFSVPGPRATKYFPRDSYTSVLSRPTYGRLLTWLSQRTKSHTKPYQCPFCRARHAIKPHHERHVNERHHITERYYCRVLMCERSLAGGGKPFPRMDNCRRHMEHAHKFSKEQARRCDMDEETRRIRAGRKVGRRAGS